MRWPVKRGRLRQSPGAIGQCYAPGQPAALSSRPQARHPNLHQPVIVFPYKASLNLHTHFTPLQLGSTSYTLALRASPAGPLLRLCEVEAEGGEYAVNLDAGGARAAEAFVAEILAHRGPPEALVRRGTHLFAVKTLFLCIQLCYYASLLRIPVNSAEAFVSEVLAHRGPPEALVRGNAWCLIALSRVPLLGMLDSCASVLCGSVASETPASGVPPEALVGCGARLAHLYGFHRVGWRLC